MLRWCFAASMVEEGLSNELLQRFVSRLDHIEYNLVATANSRIDLHAQRAEDAERAINQANRSLGQLQRAQRSQQPFAVQSHRGEGALPPPSQPAAGQAPSSPPTVPTLTTDVLSQALAGGKKRFDISTPEGQGKGSERRARSTPPYPWDRADHSISRLNFLQRAVERRSPTPGSVATVKLPDQDSATNPVGYVCP